VGNKSFYKMLEGYQQFREKYVVDESMMKQLADHGQKPEAMVVACCDSRVDPSLILQCDPGDLFMVRNVANIVPPYEVDERHHGTSAALEFGICYLHVKHLVILGHSQCGGIDALLNGLDKNDFVSPWVSLIDCHPKEMGKHNINDFAKSALFHSYENCLTFPWIREKIDEGSLKIHLWFFDIKTGELSVYSFERKQYEPLFINK